DLSRQPGRVRPAAVPVVLGERGHRVLPPAVVHTDAAPGPAGLCFRILLLRLYRDDHLLRAAHPRRDAGLPAWAGPAEELRHPAPGHADRVRALPAVAPVPLRAGDLATGHRSRLGARVRHLGWRLGPVDELAPDQDAGQLAATVPYRDQVVERRRGRGVASAGPVADRGPRLAAVRGP